MVRSILMTSALLLFAGASLADEIKGTVRRIDAAKFSLVVEVDGTEKTFTVARDAEIFTQAMGKKNKAAPKVPVSGGLGELKEGAAVTLITIKSNDKDIVSSIKLEAKMRKKKRDK